MTRVFFSDLETHSPSGRFTLTARSPHNGAILRRGGRKASWWWGRRTAFQNEFRFQLLEHIPGSAEPRLVWERWQKWNESSPHQLFVSDTGWSILRTHGPQLIAVSPSGRDVLRVDILGPREGKVGRNAWQADHATYTTAGLFWSKHAWPYFFRDAETDFFIWRTHRGQRLVLDLTHAAIRPEADVRAREWDAAEQRDASALLAMLTEQLQEVQALLSKSSTAPQKEVPSELRKHLDRVVGAVVLVGAHRIHACLPLLQQWESVEDWSSVSRSSVFREASLEEQAFRPIVQQSLRRLGVQPRGFAAYSFLDAKHERYAIPECLPDRRERAATLEKTMSAWEVLQRVGAPDLIHHGTELSDDVERAFEHWEYDFQADGQWTTLQLRWELNSRPPFIAELQERPSSWLQSNAREQALLER
ncbi:hypothetical protein [Corallococcus exiguus]|uniref:hypothetical protein n=1 Tax=Corallococcus exiguus TaxID=83462 RepID=UPI00147177A1|nr:hypothetical protein [Corallococcus exiguus]NNB85341.1 hypothetical protein [Corallococcus exiguus]